MARKPKQRGDEPARPPGQHARAEPGPDPEPWEGRRRPAERPRHEHAEPESPDDPNETSAAIAAQSWGEVIEVSAGETVDGDFNGAPELAGLEDTRNWEGTDALDAMHGAEAEAARENASAEEVLADVVEERRQVLIDRLDEARALGLEEVFENAIRATEPDAGNHPVVRDEDVIREQLAQIDAAIEQLERRSAEEPSGERAR
jgi:hypothetical protein